MDNYTTPLPEKATLPRPGYVYIIKADSGHYKIGKSIRPDKRVGEFTLQLPFKVEIIQVIKCKNYTESERRLHSLCAPWHVNGEWFLLPDTVIDLLRCAALCGQMPHIIDFWHEEYSDLATALPDYYGKE